jgi:Flp pilus assembly protein TadD
MTMKTTGALVGLSIAALSCAAFAQTTTDSSENHRPPEYYMQAKPEESEYNQAKRLLRRQQYAEAIPHLQFALADKPQDADILNELGLAKRMVGDYDGSAYYYQRALAIEAGNKDAHEGLGELDLAKNDLPSAQNELATLTTLCPNGCDERNALAAAIAHYKPGAPPAAKTSS